MNEEKKKETGASYQAQLPQMPQNDAQADSGRGSERMQTENRQAETPQTPQTPSPEMPETEVKQEKSGGATIVDFDYNKYADVEKKATHTDAAAGLALGIASLVTSFFVALIGVALGIIGMVFSIRGRRDYERKGMATAGLVCSIIGIVVSVLAILGTVLLVGFIASDMFYYM